MKEAGWMACDMDEENVSLPMNLSMKVNSGKESSTAMERCHGGMVVGTKANGGMAKCKVTAKKSDRMAACGMKEPGPRGSH